MRTNSGDASYGSIDQRYWDAWQQTLRDRENQPPETVEELRQKGRNILLDWGRANLEEGRRELRSLERKHFIKETCCWAVGLAATAAVSLVFKNIFFSNDDQ